MGGQPESPREPHAWGETHDLMPLIPPTACRMQSRLALITRRPRLVLETLAESRLAVNIMTCRICSRQVVCDLGRTARRQQILHLSSSLPGPVKPHGIGRLACAYGVTLRTAPFSPSRRISPNAVDF